MLCFYSRHDVLPLSILEFLEPCLDGISSSVIKCVFCNVQRSSLERGLEGPWDGKEDNIPEEYAKEGSDDSRF